MSDKTSENPIQTDKKLYCKNDSGIEECTKTSTNGKNRGGRPTREEAFRKREAIRFYYDRGIRSIRLVQQREGFSYRTINAFFTEWDEEFEKEWRGSFIERQRKVLFQLIKALDIQILELLNIQSKVNRSIQIKEELYQKALESGDENKASESIKTINDLQPYLGIKLASTIFDMLDKKASLLLTPTLSDHVKIEVKKLIEKIQRSAEPLIP